MPLDGLRIRPKLVGNELGTKAILSDPPCVKSSFLSVQLSDRRSKENITNVNAQTVLECLASVPIATWNSKAQSSVIRHMGPMAQDFYAAFGLGEDDRHISTIDTDGVALAAIQGLNRKLEEQLKAKDAELQALKQRLSQQDRASGLSPFF